GTSINWTTYHNHPKTHHTPLPTYPFQHHTYWPRKSSTASADLSSAGFLGAEHPLLTTTVDLANSDGSLFTGRISLDSHAWLADHTVMGNILLPGTAFLELALYAAHATGMKAVEELTFEHPLALPEIGGVFLQLAVSEPTGDGLRTLTIHSRPDRGGRSDSDDAAWQRHAVGTLSAEGPRERAQSVVPGEDSALGDWPPAGARRLSFAETYAEFGAAGMNYGPVFQGLRSAWRRGDEVFVEVALPDEEAEHAAQFGVHPALLDSVLHGVGAGRMFGENEQVARLPFSWSGVTLHSTGAPLLRAKLSPAGEDSVRLSIADGEGRLVAHVDRLAMRKLSPDQLTAAEGSVAKRSLFQVSWSALQVAPRAGSSWSYTVIGEGAAPEKLWEGAVGERGVATHALLLSKALGAAPYIVSDTTMEPDEALATAAETLEHLQGWAASSGDRAEGQTLVVVTRHAVSFGDDPEIDAPGATVWGMVRSAQAEYPGRVVLVDIDDDEASWATVPDVMLSGESQVAIRHGLAYTPRLTHTTALPDHHPAPT
ncbi:polyketide synthase dehydratase domain-containing protein, partial [Streptomyces griseus]|uniref:polyketide synthase dehydratase domain-containing protein n=1 Tax=Streptomyces griseus TaxID=1911 RepID=UPI0036CFF6CE